MLNATQAKSVAGTEQYFDACLSQSDYYLDQEVAGRWYGAGADSLGLGRGSIVTREDFVSLLKGYHPHTGKALAQRIKENRRPGMDFTFSVKKSVSLVWAINKDERIIEALQETVREVMEKDLQPLVCRRVRHGNNATTRNRKATGKLLFAEFLHKTARPVKEKTPDPHLHIHAFCMNWTEEGGKQYAAEMEEAIRQLPSLQAKFDARLARRLQEELGYEVERVRYLLQSGQKKASWEIKGIERSTIEKFSKRTDQIEEFAAEHDIQNAEEKAKLGQKVRDKKDKGATVDVLRSQWQAQLTDRERSSFEALRGGAIGSETGKSQKADVLDASIEFAMQDLFERNSVVEKHQLVGRALEHGLVLLPEEVEAAIDGHESVITRQMDVDGGKREFVTTQQILNDERALILYAQRGIGRCCRIGPYEHDFNRDWLNDEQKQAVRDVLASRDRVCAVMGGAGTGKSSITLETAEAIRKAGKQFYAFAPTTGARDVLQEKGFEEAQTVEHLLRNPELQSAIQKEDVLWIDEAGLIDTRSMLGIFSVAKQRQARIVLAGDTRQHAAVGRGDAMRLLETEAKINIARINTIQRQKGAYKQAVELISRGHEVVDSETGLTGLVAGFDMLDAMGKIHEIPDSNRHEKLAERYLESQRDGRSVLVVSPTHAEGQKVTDQIRRKLTEAGAIGQESVEFSQLKSMNLSVAEKREVTSYCHENMVVQFMQNVRGGYKRGQRYQVVEGEGGLPVLRSLDGKVEKAIPYGHADRFEVYGKSVISLARGDQLRLTHSGVSASGKRRFSNGRLDEVERFDKKGNVVLKSGLIIDKNFGHVDFGYSLTSHASQGKDRQVAISAMGAQSLPAINAKQLYVTASRGKEDIAIYVDDKAKVRSAIQRAGERLSATEIVSSSPNQDLNQKPSCRVAIKRRQMQRQAHQRALTRHSRQQRSTGAYASGNVRRPVHKTLSV